MKILVINGPNLNLTGSRDPKTYGKISFEELEKMVAQKYPQVEMTILQSNHEGELIDWLQKEPGKYQGLIINAGGLSHTSVSLADAVDSVGIPKIEVHLSHIFSREEFRRSSLTAPFTDGLISGLGMNGYLVAIQYLFAKYGKG